MSPELVKALTFFKEDPKAILKMGILCGFVLVPLLGWVFLLGYCTLLYRNYISGQADDRLLPEWEEFGDIFFKGAMALFGLGPHIIGGFLLYGAIVLTIGLGGMGTSFIMGGGETVGFMTKFLNFLIALVARSLLFAWCGAQFAGYAATLESGACFRVFEGVQRLMIMGKPYYILCALVGVSLTVVTSIFNILTIPGYVLTVILSTYLLLCTTYGLAERMQETLHPVLSDSSEAHIPQHVDELDEDEYGHASTTTTYSASNLASRRPDVSLTWDTSSDKAER